jgi:hypothetical protein
VDAGRASWLQRSRLVGRYKANVTAEDDEREGQHDSLGKASSRLRVVSGPLLRGGVHEPVPAIRLRREFKGLTVADLHRDEIVRLLPGQVRSALNHIERGELDAAERALHGQFATVLAGPGYRRRYRFGAFGILAVLAVAIGGAIATWLTS